MKTYNRVFSKIFLAMTIFALLAAIGGAIHQFATAATCAAMYFALLGEIRK